MRVWHNVENREVLVALGDATRHHLNLVEAKLLQGALDTAIVALEAALAQTALDSRRSLCQADGYGAPGGFTPIKCDETMQQVIARSICPQCGGTRSEPRVLGGIVRPIFCSNPFHQEKPAP